MLLRLEEDPMKMLIVEDDLPLGNVLQQAFVRERHIVELAKDGESAVTQLSNSEYDSVLLDLTLPGRDGFEVLRSLRQTQRDCRVLVISGRSQVEERVRALDAGADDFLLKPFSLMELSARVRALMRRRGIAESTTVQVEDLIVDRLAGRVERGGMKVDLSQKEFSLLEYLAQNAGKPVARAAILKKVWNQTEAANSNIIDVYINYIRKPFTADQVKEHLMPILEQCQ
jgi:DNA-binding response OmpR family regulator